MNMTTLVGWLRAVAVLWLTLTGMGGSGSALSAPVQVAPPAEEPPPGGGPPALAPFRPHRHPARRHQPPLLRLSCSWSAERELVLRVVGAHLGRLATNLLLAVARRPARPTDANAPCLTGVRLVTGAGAVRPDELRHAEQLPATLLALRAWIHATVVADDLAADGEVTFDGNAMPPGWTAPAWADRDTRGAVHRIQAGVLFRTARGIASAARTPAKRLVAHQRLPTCLLPLEWEFQAALILLFRARRQADANGGSG